MKTNARLFALALTLALLLGATPAGAQIDTRGLLMESTMIGSLGSQSAVESGAPVAAATEDAKDGKKEISAIWPFKLGELDKGYVGKYAGASALAGAIIQRAIENGETVVFQRSLTGVTPGVSWVSLSGIPIDPESNNDTRVNYQTFRNAGAAGKIVQEVKGLKLSDFLIRGGKLLCKGVELEDGQSFYYDKQMCTCDKGFMDKSGVKSDFTLGIAIPGKGTGAIEVSSVTPGSKKPLFACNVRPDFKVNFAIHPKLYVALSDMEIHEEFFDAATLSRKPIVIDYQGQQSVTITLSNPDLSKIQTIPPGDWSITRGSESSTGGGTPASECDPGECLNPKTGMCERCT